MMRHADQTWLKDSARKKEPLATSSSAEDHGASHPAVSSDALDEIHRKYEARLGRIDHVTMLPNRTRFLEDMRELLCTPAATGKPLAMVLVTLADARHFNEILRALGHGYSEDFIRAGAERIGEYLSDVQIYHVSVLSFAFLLTLPRETGEEPPETVERLVQAFRRPLTCRNIPIDTVVGIGVTPLDPVINEPAELLRTTLAAAQYSRSKSEGWSWYDKKSDDAHMRAFRLLSDLKPALERDDQLYLDFQPRICLKTREVLSAEALLRWRHPEFGLVSPGEFMPLAEATALIKPLTRYVIDMALDRLRRWQNAGVALSVSVNISPKNLMEEDFVDYVLESCAAADVRPQDIELEFTEGTVTADNKAAVKGLSRFRSEGIEIAIDDFGSGYSNMNYLTTLPASVLKIDQMFIRMLDERPDNEILIRSIIDLGHRLGYRIVAEGIETEENFDRLARWGCEEGQGFFMSRPVAPDALLDWLKRWR